MINWPIRVLKWIAVACAITAILLLAAVLLRQPAHAMTVEQHNRCEGVRW